MKRLSLSKTNCQIDKDATMVAGETVAFSPQGCLPLEARMHAYFYFTATLSFPREPLLLWQVRESPCSSKLNLIQPSDIFNTFSPAPAK